MPRLLDDPYLAPYAETLRSWKARADERARTLTGGKTSLADWAMGHEYYGLHRTQRGWTFREWAPNATAVSLVGDFNAWHGGENAYECRRLNDDGDWECVLPPGAIHPNDNYLLAVKWNGGEALRVPSFARYTVQDAATHEFAARVLDPKRHYAWKCDRKSHGPKKGATRCIYEAHVGMSGEAPRVSTYAEFRRDVLPRIKAAGYDTVQLMGVMEHPYYGSFGYHVSSFFAVSSRCGTPDDFRALVDAAHGLGLDVIIDLVHSHAARNEREGLTNFDGTDAYFHDGARGWHSAWGSRCFDYGRPHTLRFLLSNCRYWLDEFHLDGFRFDGVTSMLYHDHGLGTDFTDYSKYFGGAVELDAWAYLNLANRVIHAAHPKAFTIAEDVSGLPGCAAPVEDCGLGFDYRMAMGEPDYWFRLAEKVRDEDWSVKGIFHELTNRRQEEKVVSYVESHDQALVGGKTFFFQLADAAVYRGMGKAQHGLEVERAIALHKMARLATRALAGGAYLNFMGNEFGHPEWIDFPRAENGWDYSHARRQWSLRDDPSLRFTELADFDADMLRLLKSAEGDAVRLAANERDQVLAFVRGDLLFAFNFNPEKSFTDYGIMVPPATHWRTLLDTDRKCYGGQGRLRHNERHDPILVKARGELVQQIRLYLPARTAVALRRSASGGRNSSLPVRTSPPLGRKIHPSTR